MHDVRTFQNVLKLVIMLVGSVASCYDRVVEALEVWSGGLDVHNGAGGWGGSTPKQWQQLI